MLLLRMFLRSTNRRKDGKDHRYFSVVENRRLPGGKTAQRTILLNNHKVQSVCGAVSKENHLVTR